MFDLKLERVLYGGYRRGRRDVLPDTYDDPPRIAECGVGLPVALDVPWLGKA